MACEIPNLGVLQPRSFEQFLRDSVGLARLVYVELK